MFRTIFLALALPVASFSASAQPAVLGHFAGVSPVATPKSLAAEGFSCRVVAPPSHVLCISEVPGFAELGIPVMNRQVRFNGDALVYVRAISAPVSDPLTALGSIMGRVSSVYRQTERPRFLDLVDNSQRRFFSVARNQTLSIASEPIMHASGQGSISMAMFMPIAHQ